MAAVLGLWEQFEILSYFWGKVAYYLKDDEFYQLCDGLERYPCLISLLKIATESHINNSPGFLGGIEYHLVGIELDTYLRHTRRILRRVRELQTSISRRHRSGISLGVLVLSIWRHF